MPARDSEKAGSRTETIRPHCATAKFHEGTRTLTRASRAYVAQSCLNAGTLRAPGVASLHCAATYVRATLATSRCEEGVR